ncbi:Abi family protein [Cellulomonas sp. PS-H5]|uniref:Abi family protein n=1 Tax=Cellulomonas sp. PS-H5 TaxID=2820400 RepID=UPI001C4E9F09|nr:Abi family protein [Cellulomonas sp. PS-H5]MBW0254947.1 Abi family protein [Cellulomonas sp. PS-H5]
MQPQHSVALDRAISADRFTTYLRAGGGDRERARALYVWDRDVASAVLADIAIVEVAVRNALDGALTEMHGARWYTRDIGFDDRSRHKLAVAWRDLPRSRRTPGRVVAQLMFGFWVDLLDSGGTVGREPQQWSVSYEDLWRGGLARAFPGGRTEAAASGGRFTRTWTHDKLRTTQALRNRAAHHEPLVNGVPLPGRAQSRQPRISVRDGLDAYLLVLRMIDRDLADWVTQESRVQAELRRRP